MTWLTFLSNLFSYRGHSSEEADFDSDEVLLVEGEGEGGGGGGGDNGSADSTPRGRNQDPNLNLNTTFNKAAAAASSDIIITGNADSPSRKASSSCNQGASLKLQVELHRAIAQVVTPSLSFSFPNHVCLRVFVQNYFIFIHSVC